VSDSEIILGLFALVLVVFSLVVSLLIPRRDPGFPGRNLRTFVLVAALLVVAMLTAVEVFGGEDEHGEEAQATETEGGAGGEGTGTGQTDTGGGADVEAGRQIFVETAQPTCGSCHTLEAAGTSGTIGPNLDDSQVSLEQAIEQITNGGGAMPAFGGQLSEEEIQNVAAFVVESQG
jgi:cytochrome c6